MKIKVWVFDFDGTLVDSNDIKYNAFFKLFPENKKTKKVIKKVLSEIGKKSRFEILRQIFLELKNPANKINGLVREYAEKYNQMVQKEILLAYDAKTTEIIKNLSDSCVLYINSATPEESLLQTVKNLGIARFFRGIYGQPGTKKENLKKIISQEKVKSKEVVVVGDGEDDHDSAKSLGCLFIKVTEPLTKPII
ncbi:HAD-IA family hydrolase [Patescibacteria group bacterium]|nr:HAD-IA family hydrolase [Patescibacteria group bacterium]